MVVNGYTNLLFLLLVAVILVIDLTSLRRFASASLLPEHL